MKIPEKMPLNYHPSKMSHKDIERFFNIAPKLEDVFRNANSTYLYWDDFKYKPMPEGVRPEEAWWALKFFSRGLRRRSIPLTANAAFSYIIPESALELLHLIDTGAGGQMLADDPHVIRQDKERYVITSLIEEAIASSQIEGAVTTRAKAKEMLRAGRQPRDHGEKMIFNNYKTMEKIKSLIKRPLTPDLIKELHASISHGTLDDPSWEGNFRTEPVEVHDQEDKTVLFTPPASDEVPASIDMLCRFAEEDGNEFIHPVVKGIILHFRLAYIHPFMDGNGRTARALFYWHMLRRGYWMFEYIPISRVILKRRSQYYKSFLYSELDENDMTYFIMFHLNAIRDAVADTRKYISRRQREAKNAMLFLRAYPTLNHRQRALLASALEKPDEIYTFEKHAIIHGTVYQTARADIMQLHGLGLLTMRKEGRKMVFVPADGLKEKLSGGR